MIYRIKKLLKKHEEIILYGIFGFFTTIVNIIIFYLLNELAPIKLFREYNYIYASIIAFIGAVIFAFIVNKYLVFKVSSKINIKKEVISFISLRILSLLFDLGIMYILVNLLFIDDLFAKFIANIIVIILNYLFSKLIIFKR